MTISSAAAATTCFSWIGGLERASFTPEQFAALIKSEVARYAGLVTTAGIKAE